MHVINLLYLRYNTEALPLKASEEKKKFPLLSLGEMFVILKCYTRERYVHTTQAKPLALQPGKQVFSELV